MKLSPHSGSLDVAQIIDDHQRHHDDLMRLLERQRRDRERREEQAVLRRYHQADPEVRQTIVDDHKAVFDRIAANRKRAQAIARTERAAVDADRHRQGYLIRPTGLPRYVRPTWSGVIASVVPSRNDSPELRR